MHITKKARNAARDARQAAAEAQKAAGQAAKQTERQRQEAQLQEAVTRAISGDAAVAQELREQHKTWNIVAQRICGNKLDLFYLPQAITDLRKAGEDWVAARAGKDIQALFRACEKFTREWVRLEHWSSLIDSKAWNDAVEQLLGSDLTMASCRETTEQACQKHLESRLEHVQNEDAEAQDLSELIDFILTVTGHGPYSNYGYGINSWGGRKQRCGDGLALGLPDTCARKDWNQLVSRHLDNPHCLDFFWQNEDYLKSELMTMGAQALDQHNVVLAKMLMARAHWDKGARAAIGEPLMALLALMVHAPSIGASDLTLRQILHRDQPD